MQRPESVPENETQNSVGLRSNGTPNLGQMIRSGIKRQEKFNDSGICCSGCKSEIK